VPLIGRRCLAVGGFTAGFIWTPNWLLESQIELNRASWAPPALHQAQIKMPGLGQTIIRCLVRRIFWPKPGIFIRRGSLWVTILVRNPGKIPVFYGKIPVFSLVVLALF
jgi:hypothetical protein